MGCVNSKPNAAAFTLEMQSPELTGVIDELNKRGNGNGGATRRESLNGTAPEMAFKRADFTMRDIIGKGGKSVGVQVAFHHATQHYFAIKFISRTRAEAEAWEVQPLDEMRVMREVTAAKCPFITPLRGWFEDNGTVALVMSYMPGGELFSRLNGRHMCMNEAIFYVTEIVLGLEALHSLGYIYRDLKPENILLDEDGHIHICDMGFAIKASVAYRRLGWVASACPVTVHRTPYHSLVSLTSNCGDGCALAVRVGSVCRTPQFLAPEIIAKDSPEKGYTRAVDWWALGCLMVRKTPPRAHGAP